MECSDLDLSDDDSLNCHPQLFENNTAISSEDGLLSLRPKRVSEKLLDNKAEKHSTIVSEKDDLTQTKDCYELPEVASELQELCLHHPVRDDTTYGANENRYLALRNSSAHKCFTLMTPFSGTDWFQDDVEYKSDLREQNIVDFGKKLKNPAFEYDETVEAIEGDCYPVQTSTIIGPWPKTIKLGGCEIMFPAEAVDKCTMVAFTLSNAEKEKERVISENPEEITVTPVLTCLPSMQFKKPVTITLPSCYKSSQGNMPVTIKTEYGGEWTTVCEVQCKDGFVTFASNSFCQKKGITKESNADIKSLLLKFLRSDKESGDPMIECRILKCFIKDADCGVPQFQIDIRRDQNLTLLFKCEKAELDQSEINIQSKEIFRENPINPRMITFVTDEPARLGKVTCRVKDGATQSKINEFSFPFPPLPTSTVEAHISSNISAKDFSKKAKLDLDAFEVLHASQEHYENHLEKPNEIYQIRATPKGYALILSNINFAWEALDERKKTKLRDKREYECNLMEKLFKHLGCEVEVEKDKTAKEMHSLVKNFAMRPDHTDFCVMFIMTHGCRDDGNRDYLVGIDGKFLKTNDLVKMFCNDEVSEQLNEKPRLLFFESCRGVAVNRRVKVVSQDPATNVAKAITEQLEKDLAFASSNKQASNNIPYKADVLLGYATTDGFKAFQCWYTEAIAQIFSKFAKNTHIMGMLPMVRQAVSQNKTKDQEMQCSCEETYLRKDFYFFPGIGQDNDDMSKTEKSNSSKSLD
ncbi:unnamed protein product [Clavelina lepadiformis]|uniref:Caspase n=1 Tax=Clavelina lepadiformis TaxID=159417 RepID=A0ABP0G777_CLALP